MKKLLFMFLLGILFHKVVFEVANHRAALAYNSCVKPIVAEESAWTEERRQTTPSAFQRCEHLLAYNKVEQFILYQPNFWCHKDDSVCL